MYYAIAGTRHMNVCPEKKWTGFKMKDLINTVKRIYNNVPYYREKMQKKGIEPGDIKSVDDLKKLPFTYKQDLRDTYPYGLFATPMSEIVRIHASSGTTGKQTVVGYTRKDIDTWSEVMARTLASAGATKNPLFRLHMVMDFLQEAWVLIMELKKLALQLYPFQVEIQKDRYK